MTETANDLIAQSGDECHRLLTTHRPQLGRLGFVDGGWPMIFPMNYAVDGKAIYFKTAPGSKLFAAVTRQQASVNSCDTIAQRRPFVRQADTPDAAPTTVEPRTKRQRPKRDGRMTCGARCQSAKPARGHTAPRIRSLGNSSLKTPRHSSSSPDGVDCG